MKAKSELRRLHLQGAHEHVRDEALQMHDALTRKDELLREAMYLIEESITFLEGEDMDHDEEDDLITRIRKEVGE